MRLTRPAFSHRSTLHRLAGFWLSLLAVLTILSAPAHGVMGGSQARAVTLCTAQGMMTVWMDDASDGVVDDFSLLKLKASQQCLSCLVHLPNLAPPSHALRLTVATTRYRHALTPLWVDIATPLWRWASPRAPPSLSHT